MAIEFKLLDAPEVAPAATAEEIAAEAKPLKDVLFKVNNKHYIINDEGLHLAAVDSKGKLLAGFPHSVISSNTEKTEVLLEVVKDIKANGEKMPEGLKENLEPFMERVVNATPIEHRGGITSHAERIISDKQAANVINESKDAKEILKNLKDNPGSVKFLHAHRREALKSEIALVVKDEKEVAAFTKGTEAAQKEFDALFEKGKRPNKDALIKFTEKNVQYLEKINPTAEQGRIYRSEIGASYEGVRDAIITDAKNHAYKVEGKALELAEHQLNVKMYDSEHATHMASTKKIPELQKELQELGAGNNPALVKKHMSAEGIEALNKVDSKLAGSLGAAASKDGDKVGWTTKVANTLLYKNEEGMAKAAEKAGVSGREGLTFLQKVSGIKAAAIGGVALITGMILASSGNKPQQQNVDVQVDRQPAGGMAR